MKIVKKHKMIALVIVILICLLYLNGNSTYTSYESEVTGNVDSDIADWKIKVNDTLITTESEQVINIDSINWETNHTRDGKVSPGATGTIEITIDPTSTKVAFDYELTVIDQSIDPTKILIVNEIDNEPYPTFVKAKYSVPYFAIAEFNSDNSDFNIVLSK